MTAPAPAWASTLPRGWQARRLRTLAGVHNSNVDKTSNDGETQVRLCNYTDVYYNDYISNDLDLMAATATAVEIRRFGLRAGDVIITKDSESWNDIAVPACAPESLPGVVCGYHLAILRPLPGVVYGRFLFRCLQATGVREQFWLAANGVTRFGLGQLGIKDSLLPLPPLRRQEAIADFLDRKTAAINALIEKKERLIALLAEKRAALIHQAVTKGLDPTVPMKPSGIPWIGDIPAHWEVWTVANLIRARRLEIQDGNHGELHPIASEYVPDGIPFVMANNLRAGRVDVRSCARITRERAESLRIGFARTGDVLLSHKGTIGAVAVLDDLDSHPFFMLTPQVTYYRALRGTVLPRFLAIWLEGPGFQEHLRYLAGVGSTRSYLGITAQRELMVVVPPRSEQAAIVSGTTPIVERVDRIARQVERQIDKLREYRQALITAAVTGQLEIPEAAA